MNKLSKRLEAVADFVTDSNSIIDVGCDHAYLSIYLANKYKNLKIIASDINKNALDSAKKNIEKASLSDRIITRLGSGIEVIEPFEVDTIIISGMGSNIIVGFLKYSRDKLKSVKNIIIQSNTDLYFLRKNICKLGFYIEDEVLVLDSNIIYTVIKFTKGKRNYNYKSLYLGPILLNKKDDLFYQKLDKDLKTYKKILSNIKSGHYLYRLKLKRNISVLEKVK